MRPRDPRRPRGSLPLLAVSSVLLAMTPSDSNSQGRPGPGIQPGEPTALAVEMERLSASGNPADLDRVEDVLTHEDQLLRLNTEEEYWQLPAEALAVFALISGLARNSAPAAHRVIDVVAADDTYLAEDSRAEALLMVFPILSRMTPATIGFLRDAIGPDSAYSDLAVETAFAIGTDETLALFAEQVRNPLQETEQVAQWFQDPLLRRRTDPAVIRLAIDLLAAPGLCRERKEALAEAMVDYQPRNWYLASEQESTPLPSPPSVENLAPETRALLVEFAKVLEPDSDISEDTKRKARAYIQGL